jgi:hypothetical protein
VGDEVVEKLLATILDLDRKVSLLVSEKDFDTKIPLDLREAAEVCHVGLLWLRERVTRKEIPAYRNGDKGEWRIFPKDVRAFVMENTNQRPTRRKSVLRKAI